MDFPIEGLHYYCETLDVTHPFPSPFRVDQYDPEFCWNGFLAEPFAKIGMRDWCVVMLQGLAMSKRVSGIKGKLAEGKFM